MINIVTYKVKPFFLYGQPLPFHSKEATDWLRTIINRHYNSNKARLKRAGVKTELFHNHDELTSKTKTLYPLIIYHHIESGFYLTGINEGILLLKELFEPGDRVIDIDKNVLLKLTVESHQDMEVKNVDIEIRYRLNDWLPLNSEAYKRYQTLAMTEKIQFLENQLLKHITGDFGKFLNLDLSGTQVNILSIENLKRSSLPYKSHDYQPFSLEFEANLDLPDLITLGNGKAFGFGRINRLRNL